MSQRDPLLYLVDMVEASRAVERFIAGKDRDDVIADELTISAVLQKLTVIGEAAASSWLRW